MRRIFTITLASLAVLSLGSCATSQLAQQSVDNDDVYGSVVKAKELPPQQERRSSYRTDEELYGGNDYSDEEYEGEYASRIDRFYYNRPWRSFYDSYYSYRYDPWYDFYGYNSFYRPGFSFSLGFGSPWLYDNFYWGYYGSPYYSRYWGPYSYYRALPYYGYYPGYGAYYPGRINSRDYRARPNRETTLGRGVAGGYYPGTTRGAVGTRSSSGRPERYTPSTNSGRTSTRPSTGTSGRTSSRPARTEQARPPRESSAPREQSRPQYSRPERTSSGSTSGSSGRSSGGGSSSGGSSSSGRPSRGGR